MARSARQTRRRRRSSSSELLYFHLTFCRGPRVAGCHWPRPGKTPPESINNTFAGGPARRGHAPKDPRPLGRDRPRRRERLPPVLEQAFPRDQGRGSSPGEETGRSRQSPPAHPTQPPQKPPPFRSSRDRRAAHKQLIESESNLHLPTREFCAQIPGGMITPLLAPFTTSTSADRARQKGQS